MYESKTVWYLLCGTSHIYETYKLISVQCGSSVNPRRRKKYSHTHTHNPTPKSIYIHLFSGIVGTNLICKLNCLRLKWSSLALQAATRAKKEKNCIDHTHNVYIINVTSNKIFLIIHCNCTSVGYIGLSMYDWGWLIQRLLCILFYFIFSLERPWNWMCAMDFYTNFIFILYTSNIIWQGSERMV